MTTVSTTLEGGMGAPYAIPGGGGGAVTASDIAAMLRRRSVLITVMFVVLTALAVAGFAAWWVLWPGYRSEALIECVSNIPDAELTVEQQRLQQNEHERFVMSQALFLKSPGILGEALKVSAVRETAWFKSIAAPDHLLDISNELIASPVRGTNFLRVSMECREPKDAPLIVNEVVNQWLHTVRQRSAEEFADEALVAAQQEMDALQSEITEARERLAAIGERLPPGATQNPGGNVTNEQVTQYAEQKGMLELELSQLEQFRTIYNDPQGVAVTAEDRAAVEMDPQIAEMSRASFLLTQRRTADSKVYGGQHAVIKELDAQIDTISTELARLRAEKLQERRADMRQAVNTAYENTRHALFIAEESLLKAEAALQDQDRLLFVYFNRRAEIGEKVEYRRQLSEYIKNLSRIKTRRTAIKVNVAQPAIEALERSSPNVLLLPLGVFLALAMSVGLGLGLELLDTSVRTSQDMVRHLDVSLLGLIPHTDDEEVAIKQVERAVAEAPRSMVAEAFRQVRTNLQFCAPAERQRTILIASPRPNDGKTTVACNLAMSLAQAGRRVLLVDANLRRPSLERIFEQLDPKGLSNLLAGEGSMESFVLKNVVPRLDVLGAGPPPPNPGELLGGASCRAFLKEAAAQYDQVIIDTSPVLLTSDALVLAAAADGVVLVVRANRNSRGVARRARNLLTDVGAHLFGGVLNAAQVARGGYFREQLRDYYEYQTEVSGRPAQPVNPQRPTPPPTNA